MNTNFETRTIICACRNYPFVTFAEAKRMWDLCGEYAEALHGVPLSKIPYGQGYSDRFFQFQEAMKQMNEIRKYNYEKANGLIEPWDCDMEGDPEDE